MCSTKIKEKNKTNETWGLQKHQFKEAEGNPRIMVIYTSMKTDELVSLWTVKQPIKMRDSGGKSLKKI